jgi:hypothetical protein
MGRSCYELVLLLLQGQEQVLVPALGQQASLVLA